MLILKTWLTPNWGDAINPDLVKLISGQETRVVEARETIKTTNYIVVGSVLKFADDNTVVWGAGFLSANENFSKFRPEIKAVRGPKTRKRLLDLNYECPEIYGDPALLFPRYYKPQVEKKFKLGIIPHWKDEFHPVLRRMQGKPLPDGVVKIHHNLGTYEFINAICSCERIASSSLHGIIAADAYGIPSIQIEFEKCDMFKFEDYYLSANRNYNNPVNCSNSIDVDKIMKSFYDYTISIDLDKLMANCPFKKG